MSILGRTTHNVSEPTIKRDWWVIDVEGVVLGRMAAEVASILRGKRKAIYTPHMDTGDHVVIINASKVVVTGKKSEKKQYFRHTMYPGGIHFTPFNEMLEDKPTEIIRLAVKGMLPKNRLGRAMIKKMKVYAGPQHPHEAQMPKVLQLKSRVVRD